MIEPLNREELANGQTLSGPIVDDGTEEYGIPGTGVVLAVIGTGICFAIGWIAFEVVLVLKRWGQ